MRTIIRKTAKVILILLKLVIDIAKIPYKILKAIYDIRVAVAR